MHSEHPSIQLGRTFGAYEDGSLGYFGNNFFLAILEYVRAEQEGKLDSLQSATFNLSTEEREAQYESAGFGAIGHYLNMFFNLLGEEKLNHLMINSDIQQLIFQVVALDTQIEKLIKTEKVESFQNEIEKMNKALESIAIAMLALGVDPTPLYR